VIHVKPNLITVKFVLETELMLQVVSVQPVTMMMVSPLTVHLVDMNVNLVTLMDVLIVAQTESMSKKDAHVHLDIMTMLNVNVQPVTINVLNVHLTNNVLFVPLTELLKILHLAHVQLDIMKMVLLNVHNVPTNVLLVLIILLVLVVVL